MVTVSASQTGLNEISKRVRFNRIASKLVLHRCRQYMWLLWKVSDQFTLVCMDYLNEEQNYLEAFRDTKLKILNLIFFNSSYFWSAFVRIDN